MATLNLVVDIIIRWLLVLIIAPFQNVIIINANDASSQSFETRQGISWHRKSIWWITVISRADTQMAYKCNIPSKCLFWKMPSPDYFIMLPRIKPLKMTDDSSNSPGT